MRSLFSSSVSVAVAGLMAALLSASCPGQWFQRQESRAEPENRPFSIFNGSGMSDSQINRDSREGSRMFQRSEPPDSLDGSGSGGQSRPFSGKGLGELPFYRGDSSAAGARWNDPTFDEQNNRQSGFFSSWGPPQNQWRPARRFEMEERPRLLGRRPTWFPEENEELNWFERMNQRSKDFWSDSSGWIQERNENMRTRRQETWDSWSRTWRPSAERPDLEPLPPARNSFESPERNGMPVDRF
jgi:hypothetical protein